jgi:hypothetical protein
MTTAFVSQATFATDGAPIPGLFDVATSAGETFNDLTTAQVVSLARLRGWQLQAVPVAEEETQ